MGAPNLRFLVIEDDVILANTIARMLRRHGTVEVAHDFETGLRLVSPPNFWSGVTIDLTLPGAGDGLALLETLRRHDAQVPVMFETATFDKNVVNRVGALGGDYVCKPGMSEHLERFVRKATRAEERRWLALDAIHDELGKQWHLSPREREVLGLVVAGRDRAQIAEDLDVFAETAKAHVHNLLRKSQLKNTKALVVYVLRRLTATEAP